MGLVTEVDDEGAPTVLIVDNNPMSSLRLSNLFKTRNFIIEHCEDGDQAVDEYIRLDPELPKIRHVTDINAVLFGRTKAKITTSLQFFLGLCLFVRSAAS